MFNAFTTFYMGVMLFRSERFIQSVSNDFAPFAKFNLMAFDMLMYLGHIL